MPATGLGLDAWWDEPAYRAAQGTFTERGAFILAKLRRQAQGRAGRRLPRRRTGPGGHDPVRVGGHPALHGRERRRDQGRAASDGAGVAVIAARAARRCSSASSLVLLGTMLAGMGWRARREAEAYLIRRLKPPRVWAGYNSTRPAFNPSKPRKCGPGNDPALTPEASDTGPEDLADLFLMAPYVCSIALRQPRKCPCYTRRLAIRRGHDNHMRADVLAARESAAHDVLPLLECNRRLRYKDPLEISHSYRHTVAIQQRCERE